MAAAVPLIIAILTALPALIQAAEALHDQTGAGPQKKLFVLDAVRKIVTVAKAADPKIARFLTPDVEKQLDDAASASIDSAVTVMNAKPAPAP